ncbi:hypothetical protein CGLAMM_08140 [Acetobacteraceae bacterium EV16G]|uniref:Uncharacterized protein n=1 Tax=Sorlinia euscelidii TaxID=3081148 RepID=A0ABU7U3I4_9PROT
MLRTEVFNSICAFGLITRLRSGNLFARRCKVCCRPIAIGGAGRWVNKIEAELRPILPAHNNKNCNDSYFNGKHVLSQIRVNGTILFENTLVNHFLICALIALKLFLMSICDHDLLEL